MDHRAAKETMTQKESVDAASMHPIVTGRLCVCNGLCHRDTLPDGMRCTLDEQLDSLKAFVVVCIDRTRESDLLVFGSRIVQDTRSIWNRRDRTAATRPKRFARQGITFRFCGRS